MYTTDSVEKWSPSVAVEIPSVAPRPSEINSPSDENLEELSCLTEPCAEKMGAVTCIPLASLTAWYPKTVLPSYKYECCALLLGDFIFVPVSENNQVIGFLC